MNENEAKRFKVDSRPGKADGYRPTMSTTIMGESKLTDYVSKKGGGR